jgi:hypothetical protein
MEAKGGDVSPIRIKKPA